MTWVVLRCFCGGGGDVWQGCICWSAIQKGKPFAESMFFPSKLLTIDYSVHFQKQDVFLWWGLFFFFFYRHMGANTHTPYMHIGSQIYTQTPDLVFLLSRRSMNKTGVQRLSEKQWETWGVLADLSAAVAVCSCHNLRVWTYRISLDAVSSENTHSFC